MGLRQTSQISSLREDPDKVFPGLDMKFKLFDETRFRPQISIGLQSAFGHKRMAGEYLTFSKRYENFDFTAGFGWGRFGTRHTAPNPLDWTGSYFDKNRDLDGDKPNSLKDWFTGDTGFFAGVEYATPLKGLNLKFDISSDAFKAERNANLKRNSPYSFGLSYQPVPWLDTGIAMIGKDTVMARISIKTMLEDWPFKPSDQKTPEFKTNNLISKDGITSRKLDLNPNQSSPYQYSQAWRVIANNERNSDILRLEPNYFGLRAPAISINKRDLFYDRYDQGSAEEIWRNVEFDTKSISKNKNLGNHLPAFKLRESFSLSEDDAPFIHRTDIIATLGHQTATNFLSETSFRYNLFSNLDHIDKVRIPSNDPVRSDNAYYVKRKFAVERAFLQGFKSFSTNWHISASTGYLDEMFAGYHGEILYRPWSKNWAVGMEAAEVIKRDYETSFNLGFLDKSKTIGHLNFYYEVPDTNMTIQTSIGQYIGQDKGGTISFKNRFKNGSTIEAFITATDMHDIDAYGGYSNLSSGLRFTLPLGSIKYIPDGSGVEINAVPVARDAGQRLDLAHPLYEMTEPLSYRHLVMNWGDVAP